MNVYERWGQIRRQLCASQQWHLDGARLVHDQEPFALTVDPSGDGALVFVADDFVTTTIEDEEPYAAICEIGWRMRSWWANGDSVAADAEVDHATVLGGWPWEAGESDETIEAAR